MANLNDLEERFNRINLKKMAKKKKRKSLFAEALRTDELISIEDVEEINIEEDDEVPSEPLIVD